MKKQILLFVFIALLSTGRAQELVTLTTPITTTSATNVRLERFQVDLASQIVHVQWLVRDASNNTRQAGSAVYSTPAVSNACTPAVAQPSGATLLHTINTANFSVNSLSKRLFQQLQTDCYLPAGTIAGTPE